MKVLFLDIDGVLNTKYWYTQMSRNTPKDKYGYAFDPNTVANLKRIVEETGADIVISSSWKCMGLTQMEDMWNDRNLPGKIIGITPNSVSDELLLNADIDSIELFHIRGEEIKEWLSEHGKWVSNYAIIDDMDNMLPEQLSHFVQTNPEVGITEDDADRIITILKAKKMMKSIVTLIIVASMLISCHNNVSMGGAVTTTSAADSTPKTEVSIDSVQKEHIDPTLKVSFEYDTKLNGYTISGDFYPCAEDGEWGKVDMNFVKNGKVAFSFHSDYYSCYSTSGENSPWEDGKHYVFKYISPETDNPYYCPSNPLGYHTSFQFYDLNFDGKPEFLVSDDYRGHGGNHFYAYSITGDSLLLLNYPPYSYIYNNSEIHPDRQEIVTYDEDGVWEQMKIVFHKGRPSKVLAKDTLQFPSDSWIAKKAIGAMIKTRDFYVRSIEYKTGDQVIKYNK